MRLIMALLLVAASGLSAAPVAALQQAAPLYLLKPDRVFDGVSPKAHEGWTVLIAATGGNAKKFRIGRPAGGDQDGAVGGYHRRYR